MGNVINIAESIVKITAVRTDSEDADNPRSFGPLTGSIETADQRTAMLNQIKTLKTESDAKISGTQAILSTILASGAAALNAWEA